MAGQITIRETGEVIAVPDTDVKVYTPTCVLDGREVPVQDALGIIVALRDYWKARALRFETELADVRAGEAHPNTTPPLRSE